MQYFALGLEPPGNIARELSLYRRELFRESSDTSALAFPDLAFLAWGTRRSGSSASLGSPIALRHALSSSLAGIDGPFALTTVKAFGDCLFLELDGPLEALCQAAGKAIKGLGLETGNPAPIEAGRGFFLLRIDTLVSGFGLPALAASPKLSFSACHLALIRLETGPDPFAAARWDYICRVRRHTGP